MKKKPVVSASVIVAFVTPYINVVVGLITAWLFVHLHVLGVFHVQRNAVATAISGAVVFGVTAVLGYIAAHVHGLPIVLTKLERPNDPVPIRGGQLTPVRSVNVVPPSESEADVIGDRQTGPAPGANIPGARKL